MKRKSNALRKARCRKCFLRGLERKNRHWDAAQKDFERANPGKKFNVPKPRADKGK